MLDTGAHFYNVYETADGKYISLGPIEPQFYAELREAWDCMARNGTSRWTGRTGPASRRSSQP